MKTQAPLLNESLWCAGALALWLVVTALFIGFRPEHIVMAVLIFALFFICGPTRRLTVALAPFFIFGGLLFPVSLLAVFLFGGRIQNIDEEKQR